MFVTGRQKENKHLLSLRQSTFLCLAQLDVFKHLLFRLEAGSAVDDELAKLKGKKAW